MSNTLRLKLLAAALTLGTALGLTTAVNAGLPLEPLCSQTTTVFCSGFEEGNFSIWDDYDGNPTTTNTLLADPGPLNRAGNSIARLRVPPGRGGADFVKVLPTSPGKVTYVRWYQKWESDYDFSAPGHGSGIHAGSRDLLGRSNYRPTGADWFSAWLEPINGRMNLYVYYRGMYQDCADPNGACFGDHFPCFLDDGQTYCTKPQDRERVLPPLMQANKWYCFEMMLDAGTPVTSASAADGSLDFWIDGTEYGPWNGLWFRTTQNLQTSILQMSLFQHAEHSVGGILLDNIVVSKTRIGCSATSVQPNPPSNFTIQ